MARSGSRPTAYRPEARCSMALIPIDCSTRVEFWGAFFSISEADAFTVRDLLLNVQRRRPSIAVIQFSPGGH